MSFSKNTLLALSLLAIQPALGQTNESPSFASKTYDFLNADSMKNGALFSASTFLFGKMFESLIFNQFNSIGAKQELDGKKENATDQEKRIAQVIAKIKKILKEEHGKEPAFVACLADLQTTIATFIKGDSYGIAISGMADFDLLFDILNRGKEASLDEQRGVLSHEFQHFVHRDTKKRLWLACLMPLAVSTTWRTLNYNNCNKMSSYTGTLLSYFAFNYLAGMLTRHQETRADLESSNDPVKLKGIASWLANTWDPEEQRISKRNVHNLCNAFNIDPSKEDGIIKLFRLFSTHPSSISRAKALHAKADKLEKEIATNNRTKVRRAI